MTEELKPCSICGSPGVNMWDMEENIIKCSSGGFCHNALYGVYYNEWQSRPLEDALTAEIARLTAIIANIGAGGS